MNFKIMAEQILQEVGDSTNIISLVHCATRLRFKLKDEKLVDENKLKSVNGVLSIVKAGGQFQVVVGNDVSYVFKEIIALANITEEDTAAQGGGNIFNKAIDIISGVFTPPLWTLASTGVLKGLLSLFIVLGWLKETDTTYLILYGASDALFYFFPIILGFSAAAKFGSSPYLGAVLGASLIYPSTLALVEQPTTFLGITVNVINYTSTVLPVIFAAYFLSVLEKFFNKIMPKSIRNILSPLLAISIMTPLTLIVVGPIINILSNGLSIGYAVVIGFSSTIAGLIFGGLWQVFVMLGLHWAFIPMLFNNLALIGSDDFAVMIMPAIFSQVGAGIGVFLRSRNRNLKSLSLSSSITGLMGVTEPIIYGVNLKLKKPFIIACISGCIGGAIVGFSKARTIGGGLPGLLAIPGVIGSEGFTVAMIGITISLVISIIATYILGFDDFKDDIKFPTKK